LKHRQPQFQRRVCGAFRGITAAASLKLLAGLTARSQSDALPRHHRRGLIEAPHRRA
jgi:hypothetical protein